MDKLPKCGANYVPLTPITFLRRASTVYANHTSIIYGGVRFTWQQTYERCCRLASSLKALNLVKNDVVSILAPNVPAMYEMHFAVPMAGAVLNTINTRLDARNIAFILKHSEAKLLFVDYEYLKMAGEAINILMAEHKSSNSVQMSLKKIIIIDDLNSPLGINTQGNIEYEELVYQGDPNYVPAEIDDEWDAIALNYTSGTTSGPKGVVQSHRGGYLSTLNVILSWDMGTRPVYLWSLPLFHCNGWGITWGVAARGGTNVCIRNTAAQEMYTNIALHKVTHMSCAPTVFNILLEAKPHERRELTNRVQILTGGAPPPVALLQKIESLGFHVVHGYGLTEATGFVLVCEWQEQWNQLPPDEQLKLKARQGISTLALSEADIKNAKTMQSVPHDGKTMGEILIRGNSIMKGYLKNEKANSEAFQNDWFFTGDIGVIHSDGYIEIKDRSKDIIISGGENISSLEVENSIYKHQSVLEAAVVAMPHPKWGESPCAFVVLKEIANRGGHDGLKEVDIIAHCRNTLPHYMVPKKVHFMEELPKTNGKIMKRQLRELAINLVRNEPQEESTQEQILLLPRL